MMNDPRSILLLEDDLSVRASVAELLRDHGYTALPAGTLREARQVLHSRRPNVCVVDLNLPDGNGLDLLREANGHRLSMRIVVMTAFPLQHLRPAEKSLVAWLTKPVSPDALLEAVESAFAALAGRT